MQHQNLHNTTLSGAIYRSPESGAIFSENRLFRYVAWRTWDISDMDLLLVGMLNPSTGDEEKNDPTITRITSFAKREGYGGFVIVNSRSRVSKTPKDALKAIVPSGPRHMFWVKQACIATSGQALIGFGEKGGIRAISMAKYMRDKWRKELYCLGLNANGTPKHPLYIKGDAPCIPYSP